MSDFSVTPDKMGEYQIAYNNAIWKAVNDMVGNLIIRGWDEHSQSADIYIPILCTVAVKTRYVTFSSGAITYTVEIDTTKIGEIVTANLVKTGWIGSYMFSSDGYDRYDKIHVSETRHEPKPNYIAKFFNFITALFAKAS
jgi:hypothetical protein